MIQPSRSTTSRSSCRYCTYSASNFYKPRLQVPVTDNINSIQGKPHAPRRPIDLGAGRPFPSISDHPEQRAELRHPPSGNGPGRAELYHYLFFRGGTGGSPRKDGNGFLAAGGTD